LSQRQVVWIVSELFYPEVTSTGYFLTRIAEGLASDYEVRVLCAQPTYSRRGTRAASSESYLGISIIRVLATALNKDRLILRSINFLTISISIFLSALLRFRRGDIVISVTNPPTLPYLMAVAAWVHGARLVVLVHDVYPEIFVRLGILSPGSFLVRVIDKASAVLYNRAEKILVVGRDMAALIVPKLRARPERVIVAPHWGDLAAIVPKPSTTTQLRCKLGLENRFIVQYTGNIGRTHGIEDFVEVASMLLPDPTFSFLMIGSGAKRRWAEEQAASRSLSNLIIMDYVPTEDLADALSSADVAVISLSAGMSGISVPSRMYNVLASGRPILAICDEDSELGRVVLEESAGWVVAPGQPAKVVEWLRYASTHPEALAEMGKRARQAAERSYTLDNILSIYQKVLAEMQSK
jgi:colanic acid biosynthesis glycosyl transferase WcaI